MRDTSGVGQFIDGTYKLNRNTKIRLESRCGREEKLWGYGIIIVCGKWKRLVLISCARKIYLPSLLMDPLEFASSSTRSIYKSASRQFKDNNAGALSNDTGIIFLEKTTHQATVCNRQPNRESKVASICLKSRSRNTINRKSVEQNTVQLISTTPIKIWTRSYLFAPHYSAKD